MVLVGNKLDLETAAGGGMRQVSKDLAATYAQTIGAACFETSAIANHGMVKLIHGLQKKYVETKLWNNLELYII